MPKFFNKDVADLAYQLTRSPRRLRMGQVRGIETLLGLIEPDRAYPFDFVCYHVTGYRKRGGVSTEYAIPGMVLISDLVTMAEVTSRQANIPVSELHEGYKTHQQIADELDVSTKTIRRWRTRGLMGIRVVFGDGVNRLAFLTSTFDRFVRRNKALVARGASFTQLTPAERDRIVARAGELRAERPIKLHAAACLIAEEMGRAVETVRYTLRRYDDAHPDKALFARNERAPWCERYEAVRRCRKAGESIASIARTFDCAPAEVERILREVQVRVWAQERWEFVHHELFDAPNADAIILDAPEPAAPKATASRAPRDLPPYLQALYRTPLLTAEQEHDLFRRYNYLKFKAVRLLGKLDGDDINPEPYDAMRDLVERVESLKQRIIRANLRLVVSIAKKHVGWSSNFFEVISDGNMSLMRAVEKFDFARGTKFSTYATWAVMKNFARSIPEQRCAAARYVTGQDELLDVAADERPAAASESDRRHVREAIEVGLNELDEREREIVGSHFGLGGPGGGVTLEQLGQRFGVTKERIRQIERRALARLREVLAPSLIEVLVD